MSRILIVDDSPAHVRLARYLLEANGHEVLQAGSAEDGIVIAQREQLDLVLMDIKLPGMDGMSAIRVLRADPATHSLKTIAMTSYRDRFSAEEVRASGADRFIEKPFHYEYFLSVVNGVLGKR